MPRPGFQLALRLVDIPWKIVLVLLLVLVIGIGISLFEAKHTPFEIVLVLVVEWSVRGQGRERPRGRKRKWHSRQDSHLHLRRSKRRALVIELRKQKFEGGRRRQRSPERWCPTNLSTIFQSAVPPSKMGPMESTCVPPMRFARSAVAV